jgi:hypothetical protein
MKTLEIEEIPILTDYKPYAITERKEKGMGVIHSSVQKKLDEANAFLASGKFILPPR